MINFPDATGKPADGSFTYSENGKDWSWNGTGWDAVGGGGGTGTPIVAGTGLTGGTITTSGSVALDTAYTDARYVNVDGDTMTGELTVNAAIINYQPSTGRRLSFEAGYALVGRDGGGSALSVIEMERQNIRFIGPSAAATVNCIVSGSGSGHRYANVGSISGSENLSNIMAMGWNGQVCFRVDSTQIPPGTLSDVRLKDNVRPAEGLLEQILQLNPVWFNYSASKAEAYTDVITDSPDKLGFIAQEVEAVIPEAVTTTTDDLALRGIDAMPLIAALVSSVQDLTARLAALEAL
jgi:hypothetical protein